MNNKTAGGKRYFDPVKDFEQRRRQAGTSAAQWDTELKLRTKANIVPLSVSYLGYLYPGAGMFYIRRPLAGTIMVLAFIAGLVIIFSLSSDFLIDLLLPAAWTEKFVSAMEWISKLVSPRSILGFLCKLFLLIFWYPLFCSCTATYTYFAAKRDRDQAMAELMRMSEEKTPPAP